MPKQIDKKHRPTDTHRQPDRANSMAKARPQPVPPVLLFLGILLTSHLPTVQSADSSPGSTAQWIGRAEDPLGLVTGPLRATCPQEAVALTLQFSGTGASWPDGSGGGGLSSCGSVGQLKVTGWTGPELAAGHLSQLPGVSSVTIIDGALETVGPNVSSDNLQELSLTRNRIVRLHQMSLARCRSLRSLDLSRNAIDHLPDRLLLECRSLRSLKLNENQLMELRPEVLLGAGELRLLQLQSNQVQMLGKVENGFINSRLLSLIDLRNNGLFSYLPGLEGFCGPANATVLMHSHGCPPPPGSCPAVRHRCVGSSTHLVVTFTSCQAIVNSRCPPADTAAPTTCAVAATAAAAPAAGREPAGTSWTTDGGRLLSHLGVARDGTWLLYALAGTVGFALLQLAVSLAVCHRLKVRIARLQARTERLAADSPSLRYFQHSQPPTCSQSALSGRLTPSGRGPSSHCGFSHCGETEPLPPPPPTPPPTPPPPPPPVAQATRMSLKDLQSEAAADEEPLRMREEDE